MILKELKKTVNMGWSPTDWRPPMLVTGSAAQQVDASFSSTSQLELYALNLEDPGLDLELKSSIQTQHKFHKLAWSAAGTIIGGCDGGLLEFYNADKLLNGASDSLISSSTKHNGHVSALDINPYQKNLVASGASESEIFIWDLNNTAQPMAPGNRSQPHDNVQALAWNQQVQHILGSTFANRCVVWDLRKNEPIMKLSDSTSRTRWRALAWHPSVATQVCIASEDDLAPVVQLWDLRLAASPLLSMEGHHKGVLSVSWSRHDCDLLLSAGKDGRILCWNPNNTQPGGELVQEVWSQREWVFEASWSPAVAGVLASASAGQHLALHSLLAVDRPEVTRASASSILEAFGESAALPAVARAAGPAPAPPARAPAWLRRPGAAKFAFGGKLVTFGKCPQEAQRQVYISQVVSEPELVERASQLEAVLNPTLSQDPNANEKLAEFCRQRGDAATDQNERYTWFFLRANFLPNFRTEVLNLLGFKQDEIPSKFKTSNAQGDLQQDAAGLSRGESTETEAELSTDTSTDLSEAHTLIERKLSNLDIDASSVDNVVIPNGEDQTSLICRALVCGNLEEAVELCLDAKRIADALIIASLGSQELLYKVQKYHLNLNSHDPVSLISGSLVQSQWDGLVRAASPRCWRDTLAAIVTHCEGEALAHYCEMLGDKLSESEEASLSGAAVVCYLCAASPGALAARGARGARRGADLPRLSERLLLARSAAAARGRQLQQDGKLDAVVSEYAVRLVDQGCLHEALAALAGVSAPALRHRIQAALRVDAQQQQQPGQYSRNRTVSSHSQKRGHLTQNDTNAYGQGYDQSWAASSVQPPRPPSVASQSGGISGRSKYKVDPSVAAAPLYNQYSFNSAAQTYAGYNAPMPDHYSAASVPNPNYASSNTSVPAPHAAPFNPLNPASLNPMNPAPLNPISPAPLNPMKPAPLNPMNPAPLNPMNPAQLNPISSAPFNPMNPAQLNPINSAPLNPMNSAPLNPMNSAPLNPMNPAPLNPMNPAQLNPMNPAPLNPANPVNPAMNGGYYNADTPASKPVAPGWNDPPMLSSKPKPKPETVQSQAPITHPLFGVEPPQHIPLHGNPQPYGQQYPQGLQGQQMGFPGQSYPAQSYPAQEPAQQYPGDQYGVNQGYYAQEQRQEVREPVAAVAPPPKQPIPEQYRPIADVFDALHADCLSRANNQQTKRKLEDVQRRLETMYDMLREHRLSESAISSLSNAAALASRGDLDSAAATCGALAAGADFAAVAGFLPALKGLLQLARMQH